MIYHIFIFVVNITPMLLAHGNKFKSVNSNKQGALKTIAKRYSTNEQGVITTEINRTAVVVSCRSNNAIVDPFVIYGNDYWNAKIQNISGDILKNTNVYVAFFYFE